MNTKKVTIDCTPTWAAITPPLLDLLTNNKLPKEKKEEIKKELLRMAQIADMYIDSVS